MEVDNGGWLNGVIEREVNDRGLKWDLSGGVDRVGNNTKLIEVVLVGCSGWLRI